MELSIQTVLLNVSNLEQSIEFYGDVFDLRPISHREEAAALMVSEANRRQVLLLRELPGKSNRAGRRYVGLRMLSFEVGALHELDAIEQKLAERGALVGRGHTETYRSIIGVDPDRTEIAVASSLTGIPISSDDWKNVDDAIYMFE
jgi:catechol-2,3-dioxygenase